MSSDPYNVGLATVANGATTVTGTDTFWIGKVRKNDMFFVPAQGLQARVTTDPTDNEALAITAWAGTGLTDAAYEIIPASDSTTSAARLRDLLAQMSVIEANGRGLFYRFSDSVTDADPSSGYLRLNNLTIGSATEGYLDNQDANGATVSAVLDSWDDFATAAARGQLWLRSIADPSSFHAFRVTGSVVDGTGYRKLTLVYIGGSGSFAANDELMVMFSAQGADGANAILGVWQGAWVTATAYDVDDLVEHDGSTYICIEAHSSGTFASDLAADKWDLAVEKGDTGDDSTVPGPPGPVGVDWQGIYSGATAYVLNDAVLDNGSSWRALGATTGNAPPVLPTTSNAYWELVARAGTDGAGTGDVVGAASTVADRVAVFDGTTGKLLKDGGKTIAELVPGGYDDLLITVSLLALQVADNTNVALFLGDAGNRVADSFDALTYVDVAGATSMDSATAGVLKPTVGEASISGAIGTNIGNLTSGGGLAAAFDGADTNYAGSANRVGSGAGYVGKTYSGGKRVKKVDVRSSTGGWDSSGGTVATYDVRLYAKTGSAPSSATDGTMLAQNAAVGDPPSITALTLTSSNQTTVYDHVWVYIVGSIDAGTYGICIGEATFYEPVTNNLTVRSASFTAASTPTAMKALIRVKEVDTATAGTDYTFECSRDGGTTWATMTLTELFTSPSPTASIRVVEAAETGVSGQPSGTSPRWRFKTLNNKMVELHDVYFYWS